MSVQDRIERYSRIRAWLDNPYEQRPTPHQILNQMLVEEQWLNLKLANEGESWNLISKDLTTAAGTSEYTISQPVTSHQQAGKIYFVVRATDNTEAPYLPVRFDDLSSMDYGKLPTGMNSALSVPEKISVYRTGMQDQSLKVVIQPTPEEALTYRIWFYTGQLDRLYASMDKSGLVTELTDFIDLKASMALLPYSQWSEREESNDNQAKKLATGLDFQYQNYKPVVDDYISTINAPQDFDLGFALD